MTIHEIISQVTTCMLEPNAEYSTELNDAINMHNGSIQAFIQSLQSNAVLTILIEKGIITEDEFCSKLEVLYNSSAQKNAIESNTEMLCTCIESEQEFINNMKDIHNNIDNDATNFISNEQHIESANDINEFGLDDDDIIK